jgi:hypothetical protein
LTVTLLQQPYQASGVKLTGGNSSLISTSEKDLIILDSENDDSRTEVNDKTDNADKGTDSSEENNIEMYINSLLQFKGSLAC